jgi:hypothetical protein
MKDFFQYRSILEAKKDDASGLKKLKDQLSKVEKELEKIEDDSPGTSIDPKYLKRYDELENKHADLSHEIMHFGWDDEDIPDYGSSNDDEEDSGYHTNFPDEDDYHKVMSGRGDRGLDEIHEIIKDWIDAGGKGTVFGMKKSAGVSWLKSYDKIIENPKSIPFSVKPTGMKKYKVSKYDSTPLKYGKTVLALKKEDPNSRVFDDQNMYNNIMHLSDLEKELRDLASEELYNQNNDISPIDDLEYFSPNAADSEISPWVKRLPQTAKKVLLKGSLPDGKTYEVCISTASAEDIEGNGYNALENIMDGEPEIYIIKFSNKPEDCFVMFGDLPNSVSKYKSGGKAFEELWASVIKYTNRGKLTS